MDGANVSLMSTLIGEHPSMVALRQLVERVARSRAKTILIYGETGTGKSLVARSIHALSERSKWPLMDINCAAIPAELLESELFGHERGAFTGAVQKKLGLIEAANGGSVFLDEVRELDPVMQAKILTLLDTLSFRKVGAVQPQHVDVRFIAATNRILLSEVKAGRFREDLYYRLQVVAINIPPLRERADDVLLLARNRLQRFNAMHGSQMTDMEPAVEQVFKSYAWPGNVRELENLLERICLLEDGRCIRMEHLPSRILREVGAAPAKAAGEVLVDTRYQAATEQFQRTLLTQVLSKVQGNQSQAAVELGLTRHALRHQMHKLGIGLNVTPQWEESAS